MFSLELRIIDFMMTHNSQVVPLLEGEQMLRLLNLQNNIISHIDNLHGLPNLIFLDLYNNKIEVSEIFY